MPRHEPPFGDLIDVSRIDAAVTEREPWGTKLALRPEDPPTKRAGFRSWPLPKKYVGVPIVIHAGAAKLDPLDARRECARLGLVGLHYGALVGVVVFGHPINFEFYAEKRDFGTGVVSRIWWATCSTERAVALEGEAGFPSKGFVGKLWAWPLLRWHPFRDEHPIHARGKQRIWRLSPEQCTCLRERLAGERWREVELP